MKRQCSPRPAAACPSQIRLMPQIQKSGPAPAINIGSLSFSLALKEKHVKPHQEEEEINPTGKENIRPPMNKRQTLGDQLKNKPV